MAQSNHLTNREEEVVKLLLLGKSNKLIASSLGVSIRTVEFHLKNIYAKFKVSSRIELILKLGNTTGKVEIERLGHSTVDNLVENIENRDMLDSQQNWARSFSDTVSMIGKELAMKNLLATKHVFIGVITAIFTGFLWLTMLRRFGHMAPNDIKIWILPEIVVWTIIGLAVGMIGKRNGNTLLKVSLSTLFATGLSPIGILPLIGLVIYPLAKLGEWLGLIDRSGISTDVTSTLIIVAMLILWLIVGVAVGIVLLFITIKKQGKTTVQTLTPEHRL